MNNKNFEIYLDFGSSKIRAGAFNKNNTAKSFYSESNYFTNYLNSVSEIEKIISNLEKNTNEYLNDVNLMVDSPEILSVSISLSKNFDGLKLKKEDIQFLIQDGKQQVLKNYSDLNIIHIIIKNYKVDNVDYKLLPTDITCNSLSIDIIFICLPKKMIEDLKSIFFKLDISINQFFCSSYAKSTNYKDNFSSISNISFIDMGFNKTSITCYNNNEISFFHVLPIGGNHITKDISKVLNVDLIDAEKIKLYFDKNENFLNEKKLSLDLIQKIIFARIEEILELCTKSIKLNGNFDQSHKYKMVLMGEGSKILDNKFKEKIHFTEEIDLLDETVEGICESALKLGEGLNKQEVVVVPKKQIKEGFFEKLFHLFK
jgi:cell division protein FtsA